MKYLVVSLKVREINVFSKRRLFISACNIGRDHSAEQT